MPSLTPLFALAKSTADFLATPSNLLFLLLLTGLLALLLRARRTGVLCTGLAVGGMVLFGCTALSAALMAPLVTRFPALDVATAPAPFGIILLGGGINEEIAAHYGALLEFAHDEEVVPTAALLAARYPAARIVVSAGRAGDDPAAPLREADGIRRVLIAFGVEARRIAIDAHPDSTVTRVANTIALVGEDRDETWWVITSAHRMPRTIGTYRRAGLDPVPFPVDFRWLPPFEPFALSPILDGLERTDKAVHEWLGLLVYRWTGRTDVLFPGPR